MQGAASFITINLCLTLYVSVSIASELHYTISKGEYTSFMRLLNKHDFDIRSKANIYVSGRYYEGITPYELALVLDKIEMALELFLNNGAVDIRDSFFRNQSLPILETSKVYSSKSYCKFLKSAQADNFSDQIEHFKSKLQNFNRFFATSLGFLARADQKASFTSLLSYPGLDFNVLTYNGNRPAYEILSSKNEHLIAKFLNETCEQFSFLQKGFSLLQYAFHLGLDKSIQTILLDYCILEGSLNMNFRQINNCLLLGANVNKNDREYNTALHYAAKNEQLDLVQFLLFHDADANRVNNEGKKALDILVTEKPVEKFLDEKQTKFLQFLNTLYSPKDLEKIKDSEDKENIALLLNAAQEKMPIQQIVCDTLKNRDIKSAFFPRQKHIFYHCLMEELAEQQKDFMTLDAQTNLPKLQEVSMQEKNSHRYFFENECTKAQWKDCDFLIEYWSKRQTFIKNFLILESQNKQIEFDFQHLKEFAKQVIRTRMGPIQAYPYEIWRIFLQTMTFSKE